MATLMDKLRQTLGGGAVSSAAATGTGEEEQQQVRKLLAAKQGQVVTGPLAGGRSVAESAARQQTATELGQLAQAGQMAGAELGQQQQELAQRQQAQEAEIAGQRKANQLRFSLETQRTLADLEQNKARLSTQERGEKLEYAASLIRQQSKQYTDNLRREGDKQRLTDKIAFDEALAKDIFDFNINLAKENIAASEARDAGDREWNKYLQSIDMDDIIRASREASAQKQREAMIGGAVGLAKAGISTYGRYAEGDFDEGYQNALDELGPGETLRYSKYKKDQARKERELDVQKAFTERVLA